MEKIYMENNKKNKKFNFSSNSSIILSFAIAIISVVSVVAFGFSQISYAAPETGEGFDITLPDTFTTKVVNLDTERVVGKFNKFPVTAYYTNDASGNIPVFCLEHNIPYPTNGADYTKENKYITDYGLLYLTANLYPNKTFTDASGQELDQRVQAWISQTAIWIYLNKIGDPNNSENSIPSADGEIYSFTADDVANIVGEVAIERWPVAGSADEIYDLYETPDGRTIYETFGINTLIETAYNNRTKPIKSLSISKASDDISVTTDDIYYQTAAFTVAGSMSVQGADIGFKSYSVGLTGAPEGTIIVNENGEELDMSSIPAGTKFFVRIPKDKVTEEKMTINVTINGVFKSYEGYRFLSPGKQTITNVSLQDSVESTGTSFEIVGAPDTGMNTAQTVYFIGLIVLLSGVGIIYANAKPANSN